MTTLFTAVCFNLSVLFNLKKKKKTTHMVDCSLSGCRIADTAQPCSQNGKGCTLFYHTITWPEFTSTAWISSVAASLPSFVICQTLPSVIQYADIKVSENGLYRWTLHIENTDI